MAIIAGADVKERHATRPGMEIPVTLENGDYDDYAIKASAAIMLKSGLDAAPGAGTDDLEVLKDLAIRLAINTIHLDWFGTIPEQRQALAEERREILKEAEAFGATDDDAEGAGDPMLEIAETPLGDEDAAE